MLTTFDLYIVANFGGFGKGRLISEGGKGRLTSEGGATSGGNVTIGMGAGRFMILPLGTIIINF